MFYQKKSKSTITNDKRTSISNPNKTQIRILLHCLGSSHKRKHQFARKGTATGSQVNFVSKTNKQTNTLLSIKTPRRTEKSSLICYND